MAVVAAEYVMKMVPKGTHDANKFIRPSELISWVDGTQLKDKHIIGLHYNPMTDKFWLYQMWMSIICYTRSANSLLVAKSINRKQYV